MGIGWRGDGAQPVGEEAPARLSLLPGRTIPGHPVVSMLGLPDGTRLRTARWERDDGRGTVLICTGRGEFIEKYFEVVGDLLARRFAVVVFDWRGQGLSTRPLRDRRKGHVATFRYFEQDLAAVLQRIVRPFCPEPVFALAHSMGGAVAIHHLGREPKAFRRAVLSAPMVGIHDLPIPGQIRRLVATLNRAGLGGRYLPRKQRTAVLEHGFDDNILTSDPHRFALMAAAVQHDPELATGAPTIGWLHAAFEAMAEIDQPAFAEHLSTPMLMVIPGSDRVVSVPAMQRCAQRLRTCHSVTIPEARHEILMERDALRDQFWAAFDSFIPGSDGRDMTRQERWAMTEEQ